MTGTSRAGALPSAALAVAIAGLLGLQVLGPWHDSRLADTVRPWPGPRGVPAVRLGVTTLALARNSHQRWSAAQLREVDAFEQHVRHHADIVMWFADWAHVARFDARQAGVVAARGSIPEISWEPWDSTGHSRSQPTFRLARIIDGSHDRYIVRWAREIAAYGRPVRLRFAHEMNGRWYPWAERVNGNRPGEYVRAWRHVHRIFTAEGAQNVRWVWSPVAGSVRAAQYPGSRYVDVLGVAGFNGGTAVFRRRWRSFATAFGPTLRRVHALDRSKPVELSEIASAEVGGSKATWIRELFAEVRRRPYIRSVVWFNLRKELDWRVESSPEAQRAFAAAISRTARPARRR
jgi:beta-mannanase